MQFSQQNLQSKQYSSKTWFNAVSTYITSYMSNKQAIKLCNHPVKVVRRRKLWLYFTYKKRKKKKKKDIVSNSINYRKKI